MAVSSRLSAFLRLAAVGGLIGLAFHAAHAQFGLGGSGLHTFVNDWLYDGLVVGAAAVCLLRGATLAEDRWAWLLFGAGLSFNAAGEIYYTIAFGDSGNVPVPSLADLFYLLYYPMAYIGFVLLVRARATHFLRSNWLDGAIAAAATKSLVGRTRPPVSLHLVTENDASFPSGHATNSAAVFLTIGFVAAMYALRGPIVRTATVLAAALLSGMVGISRLVLGVHWPSDVLAGWALGLSAALTVTITLSLLARLRRTRPRDADPLLVRTARRAVDVLTIQRQARQSTLEAA